MQKYFVAFQTVKNEAGFDHLEIRGSIPDWLEGKLVRSCPAVFETEKWVASHWFDGLCMLYSFDIKLGQISFRNRFLKSKQYDAALHGYQLAAEFAQQPKRSFLKRLLKPIPEITDNCNVNVCRIGDHYLAMTETPHQIDFDPETLDTIGPHVYDDKILHGASFTAHPHYDFDRKESINLAISYSRETHINVYSIREGGNTREIIGTYRTDSSPYIHSFCLTPRYIILIHQPFIVRPKTMLWSKKPFIEHFRWTPEQGTRFIALDRNTGETTVFETEAFFTFHTVNAFEEEGKIILDLLAYPDPGIIKELYLDSLRAHLPSIPQLRRFRLDPKSQQVNLDLTSDANFELPNINYARCNMKPYRFVFGVGANKKNKNGFMTTICKVDLEAGQTLYWSEPDFILNEPIFVARPGAAEEDDGIILTVGLHQLGDRSTLFILDATRLQVLASAEVPISIPIGFHGQFYRH